MSTLEQPSCGHGNFDVRAEVSRLTSAEGGPVTGYVADITVTCRDCGTPFAWLGVGRGVSSRSPAVSASRTELRAPIEPASPAGVTRQSATRFWPPGPGQVILSGPEEPA